MQRMRDVLRGELGRSLRELSEEDRLATAWTVVCGAAMAAHGQVLRLDEERVVHVRVDGEEWMQQFLAMRAVLQSELARVAGVRLGGIHFEKQ
jgi:predicted nucleic acid-binding Zn ribbon protein